MEKTKRQCIAAHGIRIRTGYDLSVGAIDTRMTSVKIGYYYYIAAYHNTSPNRWNALVIEIT